MSRRQFLGVIGVVGVASALALVNAASSLSASQTQERASSSPGGTTGASNGAANLTHTGLSGSAAACCNRGCSFPGGCQRYVDADSNGRCDLGEC